MWHEYICPDDLERVIAWFITVNDEPIEFRCFVPSAKVWVCCVWTKTRLRENWLIVGDSVEIPALPSPPCLVMEVMPKRATVSPRAKKSKE